MEKTIFYIFAALSALSAVGVLWSKNVMYAAFLLLVCLLSASVLFVLTGAEFVALAQIMVYVGGVLVLMVFGVMNTARKNGENMRSHNRQPLAGIAACGSLGLLILAVIQKTSFADLPWIQQSIALNTGIPPKNIEAVGINLLTAQLLPFELVAVLLLLALVGVAVITGNELRKQKK